MAAIALEIHPKFAPLLTTPHSFANIEGGRGGMKSEQVHKIALLDAINRPIRTCCARETMASIRDSSHKLLSDIIHEYGMAASQNGPYEIQESRILRKSGDRIESEFIFIGIRENVRDSKSLKSINRTIIEEASKLSQDSLDVFVPTVMGRVEGSQMWFIWNPELVTDPVYKMFMVGNPPTGTLHIHTNYLENPWLTETMRVLAEDCRLKDPAKYQHIWMGEPINEVEGAIFGAELKLALDEKRIGTFPYNKMKPVSTIWDLGFGDPTAIWFVQAYDGYYTFIDYLESADETTADYVIKLQNRGYAYDTDWLPHDSIDTIIHRKLSGSTDRTKSIEMLLRDAQRKVRIVPKLLLTDQVNATRLFLNQCRFDESKCADGLNALRHYQWDKRPARDGDRPAEGETKIRATKPLHNWASHGASAFMGAAIAVKQPKKESEEAPKVLLRPPPIPGAYTPFG